MSPPNVENPAPLAGGNRAKADKIRNQEDKPSAVAGQLVTARLRKATVWLNRLTDDLAAIADWKADLAARLRRAHLRFEFIGLGPNEQEQLEAEVEAFKAVCVAMSESFARTETERRAA